MLCYLPANAEALLLTFLPREAAPIARPLAALVNPALPSLGLAASALLFVAVLARGGKLYGPSLAALGFVLMVYVWLLFRGGTATLTVPEPVAGVSVTLTLELGALMALFIAPCALVALKGVVIAVRDFRANRSRSTGP